VLARGQPNNGVIYDWERPVTPVTAPAKNDECFCDESAVAKFEQQISMRGYSHSGWKFAFLLLSGSFNPVHTQHVGALIATKKYLEGLGWTVVGGFLAPSSDSYVQGKSGPEALPLKQRIALCGLAIEGFDWLSVCVRGEMSSNWTCRGIRSELERYCFNALNGSRLTGVEIMSSDVVVRIFPKILMEYSGNIGGSTQQGRKVCCLVRPGSESSQQRKYIENVLVPGAADVGVEFMLVEPTPPLEPISSSAIRELVSKGDWEALGATGWLQSSVLEALQISTL
jgi:nicotinic acid mononucleotide adenylyltransferase